MTLFDYSQAFILLKSSARETCKEFFVIIFTAIVVQLKGETLEKFALEKQRDIEKMETNNMESNYKSNATTSAKIARNSSKKNECQTTISKNVNF